VHTSICLANDMTRQNSWTTYHRVETGPTGRQTSQLLIKSSVFSYEQLLITFRHSRLRGLTSDCSCILFKTQACCN